MAVVSFDLFGHGRTAGKRGHCPGYEALLNAIAEVSEKARKLFPGNHLYLYGHSLGGNLALNYVLWRRHDFKAVVASSPFLKLAFDPPRWKLILGKLMLKMFPSLTLPSELEVEAISRMEHEVKRYNEDPLIHDRISPIYSFPVMAHGRLAIENANKLKVPALLLHGTGDRIIDYRGSVEFSDGSELASLELFEGGYHELHHDLCREEFMETVKKWLNKV
jgi:alpha-beta hydrolase superfamily lysophospholipase